MQNFLGNLAWVWPCLPVTIGQLTPLFALFLGTKSPEELLTIAEEAQRNLEIVNAGLTLSMLHRYNSNKDLWELVIPAPRLSTTAYINSPTHTHHQIFYWIHLVYSSAPTITPFINSIFTLALKILKTSQLKSGKNPGHIVLPISQDLLAWSFSTNPTEHTFLSMFHDQIDNNYPKKYKGLSILQQISNLHIMFLSSSPIPDATSEFTDTSKTKFGFILHLIGNKPQAHIQFFIGSVELSELLTTLTLLWDYQEVLNTFNESQFAANVVKILTPGYIKTNRGPTCVAMTQLQMLIEQCSAPF